MPSASFVPVRRSSCRSCPQLSSAVCHQSLATGIRAQSWCHEALMCPLQLCAHGSGGIIPSYPAWARPWAACSRGRLELDGL